MLDYFMLHPLSNALAVIVLIALILGWFMSVILALQHEPVSLSQGRYGKLMLMFSLLGIPAIFDLLQTSGIAFVFAATASLVIVLNIAALIMQFTGKTAPGPVKNWFKWSVPILVLGGLTVSGYFVFLKLTGEQVICGPLSGCDTVQNSRYATLFGFLPMGTFGFAGYSAILTAWLLRQYGPASMKKLGSLSMWGFCVFGVLFSIYLTYLEPFVIGATCMWCITSAVFMIILLSVSTPAAQQELTF